MILTRAKALSLKKMLNTTPKTARIGPANYDVELVEDGVFVDGDPNPKMGMCHPNGELIKLSVKYMASPVALVSLFIHEALHGIWHNQGLKPKAKEEEVVQAMEIGLVQLLRDNPGLIDWIKKGLK